MDPTFNPYQTENPMGTPEAPSLWNQAKAWGQDGWNAMQADTPQNKVMRAMLMQKLQQAGQAFGQRAQMGGPHQQYDAYGNPVGGR